MAENHEYEPVEFDDELDEPRRRRKKHSILQRVILAVVVLLIAVLAFDGWYIMRCLKPVSETSETVLFTVEEGSTLQSVSDELQEKGLVRSGKIAYYYAKFEGLTDIKAGDFELDKSWDLSTIYTALNSSEAAGADTVSVTIIDGDWAKHIAASISSATNVTSDELMALWNDQEYIRSLMPRYPFLTEEMFQDGVRCYLEGYFAPNTYQFRTETTAQEVTEKILDQTLAVYNQYADQFAASSLSTHQIFTLASIVQYEGTGDMEVLKNIASVFYNRLNAGMTLGSSVTVCYAIDYDRDTDNWQSCEVNTDFDSPYNTYLHTGLPPGAVTNFGTAALEAVLSPNQTGYYYFMADVYGDGTVYFSETLEQHEAYVAQFLG